MSSVPGADATNADVAALIWLAVCELDQTELDDVPVSLIVAPAPWIEPSSSLIAETRSDFAVVDRLASVPI